MEEIQINSVNFKTVEIVTPLVTAKTSVFLPISRKKYCKCGCVRSAIKQLKNQRRQVNMQDSK